MPGTDTEIQPDLDNILSQMSGNVRGWNMKVGNNEHAFAMWHNRRTVMWWHPDKKSSMSEFLVFSSLLWQLLPSSNVFIDVPSVAMIHNFVDVPLRQKARTWTMIGWGQTCSLTSQDTANNLCSHNCLICHSNYHDSQKYHDVLSWH